MKSNTQRQYNFIYGKLVLKPDDFVGHLAYSIYKAKKIEFIKDVKEREGQDPDEQALQNFHRISEMHVDQYRLDASKLLKDYTQEALNDYIVDINKKAGKHIESIEKGYQTKLSREVENLKPKFWPGAWQSAVGSLLFTFAIGLLFIMIIGFQKGPEAVFNLMSGILNDQPVTEQLADSPQQ